MKSVTKKAASDLQPGDRIPAPSAERGWLKSTLTVVAVTDGGSDARGAWLKVVARFISPYSDQEAEQTFRFRPTTQVRLIQE